jgi:hypothetical protein
MSATAATPISLLAWTRSKSGPFLGSDGRTAGRPGDWGLTADRPEGVGTPIIDELADLSTVTLVRDAVTAAFRALRALDADARRVARQFRTLPGARAQQELTHLVESTQTLLRLAAMTAAVAGQDLDVLSVAHGRATARTTEAVASLIRQQLTQDWNELADTLDGAFAEAMGAWRSVFGALDAPLDPDPDTDPTGPDLGRAA